MFIIYIMIQNKENRFEFRLCCESEQWSALIYHHANILLSLVSSFHGANIPMEPLSLFIITLVPTIFRKIVKKKKKRDIFSLILVSDCWKSGPGPFWREVISKKFCTIFLGEYQPATHLDTHLLTNASSECLSFIFSNFQPK